MNNEQIQQIRAFTLIELLVVISVISILAGLLFPALNMIRQRALDASARDLCQQTATAWNALFIAERRLPPIALFDQSQKGGATKLDDGDIMILMNNEATSLLNWWKPRHPSPAEDAKAYKKWLDVRKIKFSNYEIQNWPKDLNDLYLERTSEQRKWGLVVPWVRRWLSGADESTVDPEKINAATVRVLLDTNGDGRIKLPTSMGGLVVNKTALAWVYADEKKERIIKSW